MSTATVGVVDDGVEGLVDPVEEYHVGKSGDVTSVLKRQVLLLVESQHSSGDEHVARHLSAHPPKQEHLLASVRMERRVVERFGLPQLLHCHLRVVLALRIVQHNLPGGLETRVTREKV